VRVEFAGVRGATAARPASKQLRDVVARLAWHGMETAVRGSNLRQWRACFPSATGALVHLAKDVDLPWLRGVRTLRLDSCPQLTGEGLQHLAGLTSLVAADCPNMTDEGLRHLGSVVKLELSWCRQITDAGLRHLGAWSRWT
jgi:hypothetical protein